MYGQMNEPPGARARVALTGLTVAEYFRDEEGQDVLLFIDNIFRFTQAGSEVGTVQFCIERFSIECHKPKTKVITLASHKGRRQYSEPIKTRK